MRAGDESFERLRAAIEDIAAGDVAELLAEARAEARARVRSMLTEAMAQTMLERAREQLETADRGELTRPPNPQSSRAASPARNPEPSRAASSPPPVRGDSGFGWYVYCVTHADGPAIRAGLPGIDPAHEVSTLQDGQLVAVVSQVPLEDFDEERLRERLADMNWLERTARRHEDVLDSIRAQRTVIPMRLCSIYRDEDGVRAMLEREAEALASALERLDGKAEWGVKVFLVGAPPPAQEIEHDPAAAPEGADAGAAYMERRRREHRQRQNSHRGFEEACTLIHERLSATAVEGLIAPPQRSEVSDHAGEMILNGVYLVPDSEQESFNSQLSVLQAEFEPLGLDLELTGPWPAYNFVPGTIGAAW